MSKKIMALAIVVFLGICVSGCALIGTAITAGISYGIYQATK